MMIEQKIVETPWSLVENGKIHTGFFKEPFRKVNLLEADKPGGKLGKPLRWLRLKEWVGFGLDHSELYGAMIIQDSKYASSGTVYMFDKTTGEYYDWLLVDMAGHLKLAEHLWHSESSCGVGLGKMNFRHELEHFRHTIKVNIKGNSKKPSFSADLILHQNWKETDPLVVSLPILPNHHTYTHKSPLHIEGEIRIGDKFYTYQPERDMGNLDEQKTFYPYRSNWYWGSFIAYSREGCEISTNFVNQMTPKDEPGEDAIWFDGKLTLVDQPEFIVDEFDKYYRIEDKAGRVKLAFEAKGRKPEKLNFGLISMDYAQNFGLYNGEITDNDGNVHHIENAFGALERMDARF